MTTLAELKAETTRSYFSKAAALNDVLFAGGRCGDGLNRYAYCQDNPVIYTDPTGHGRTGDGANERSVINGHASDPSDHAHGGAQNNGGRPGRQGNQSDEKPSTGPTQPNQSPGQGSLYGDGPTSLPYGYVPPDMPKYGYDAGPCYVGTLQQASEVIIQIALTDSEAAATMKELTSGTPPVVDKDNKFAVADSNKVIKVTIATLFPGREIASIQILGKDAPASLKAKAQVTARHFDAKGNLGEHWNLGDRQGNFLSEPMNYHNPAHIQTGAADQLRYIYVQFK